VRHLDRVLIGLLLIFLGVGVLYWGSPARLATTSPDPLYAYGFLVLFGLGFAIGSMGLLGAESDYPAFLSGFVLYFIVGGFIAVVQYVQGEGVGQWTLQDADSSGFWAYNLRLMATWPLQIVMRLRLMGWNYLDL
jgi:hypothetical protein